MQVTQIRFRKRGLWRKGLFRKIHFLDIPEISELLEILENQTVENKGVSDHVLEILENLEIFEIPPVKRPLSSLLGSNLDVVGLPTAESSAVQIGPCSA